MEYEFDSILGIDTLELYYEAHVVGFDGENFTYTIYFEEAITDDKFAEITNKIDILFKENDEYLGYIDIMKKEENVFIYHDLGNCEESNSPIHEILLALNSVKGIKFVNINEEEILDGDINEQGVKSNIKISKTTKNNKSIKQQDNKKEINISGKGKMVKNLQSEFVKYYKEKLEPYGFKKVKGKQPYFVRVINDEILHIFTILETISTEYGCKEFHLMCGVATVYNKEINFSITPWKNSNGLVYLGTINEKKDTEYPNVPIPRNLMIYCCNDENLNEVLKESYEGAKIIINELDKVSNMDEVLRYLFKYNYTNISFGDMLYYSDYDQECLFYARKDFDYIKIEKIFEDKLLDLKNSDLSDEEKRERHEGILEWKDENKRDRNKFINNEKDYEQGMGLLKEHYNTNVEKLIGYGLDIKKMDLKF